MECIGLTTPFPYSILEDIHILTDDLLLGARQQEMKRHFFSRMGQDLQVFTAEQPGYESWARGAGSLVLHHFFGSPVRVQAGRSLA